MRDAPRYDPRTLAIARVGKPHGVHGALHVHPFNPRSALLNDLPPPFPVQVESGPAGGAAALHVEEVRATPGALLVRFAELHDRAQAAAYTGAVLRIERARLPPLEPGEYYPDDLVGCAAFAQDGSPLGLVEAVFSNGAHRVLVLRDGGGVERMVPLVPGHVLAVDVAGRRVRARFEEAEPAEPPPGAAHAGEHPRRAR